jgi:DNA-binding response OmpR family regulator
MCAIFEKRVLIVDDEDLIRDYLAVFFSFNGYEAFTAGDGREALKILQNRPFNLLITDMNMPVMNGIELIREVRNLNMTIIIIGMSLEDNKYAFLKAGTDYFLSKPFDSSYLKSILSSIFQK